MMLTPFEKDLRDSRTSYPVLLRDFILKKDSSPKSLICFFEGEDVKYYGAKIEALIPKSNLQTIKCGGKYNVLRLFDRITKSPEYSDAWVAFFIDRDFESCCPNSIHLYVTPGYSIENFYLSEECITKILKSEYDLNHSDDYEVLSKIVSLYSAHLIAVGKGLCLFMAWYKLNIFDNDEDSDKKNKVFMSKFKIKDYIDFKLEKTTCIKYDQGRLLETFPDSKKFSKMRLAEENRVFKKLSVVNEFRGKCLIDFLFYFLTELKKEAKDNKQSIFESKIKVKLNISRKNIISELSSYADIPECLTAFIKKKKSFRNI